MDLSWHIEKWTYPSNKRSTSPNRVVQHFTKQPRADTPPTHHRRHPYRGPEDLIALGEFISTQLGGVPVAIPAFAAIPRVG
eukprot:scaffold214981_cov43-Tisochrysis_lutea.AAC.1